MTRCAEYRDGDPAAYQFPFSEQDDFDANGNLHLSGTADDPGILDLALHLARRLLGRHLPRAERRRGLEPADQPGRLLHRRPAELRR